MAETGQEQIGVAPPDIRDAAYRALISSLGLDAQQRFWLKGRGLEDQHIEHGGWRTFTRAHKDRVVQAVIAAVGEDEAVGIPGIWQHENGGWDFVAPAGLIVPVCDDQHRYVGLRCIPEDGVTTVWATTPAHGTEPFGAWVHLPMWTQPDTEVRVVPTVLDAEVASAVTGIPSIACSDPSAWPLVEDCVNTVGATEIRWVVIGDVPEGLDDAIEELASRGFDVSVENWPEGHGPFFHVITLGATPVEIEAEPWLVARARGVPARVLPGPPPASAPPVRPAPIPENRVYQCTDYGNAERLVAAYGRDVRYDWEQGRWLVWDGQRWEEDRTGEIERRSKSVSRGIINEAKHVEDPLLRRELEKWAHTSEGKGRLNAMLTTARSEPGVKVAPGDLDNDPWLLNVGNGTIDLRTGRIRPHDRGDLLTKMSKVTYDPKAKSALWEKFIDDTTAGDKDLARFVQRLVGYSLVGITTEEVLIMLYGRGGTGKTTFVEAIKSTLGDYAKTADFNSFINKRESAGPRDDIAELAGSRFVSSSEVDEGKRLAAALVKQLTGTDTIRARRLYKEGFEFQPQFQLWLVCNHAPKVDAWDSGFWRRVLRVPFEEVIPEDKRDPRVKATLTDPSVSGPAILTWAVEGCLMWQREGINPPEIVRMSTAEYRAESDPLADFLEDAYEFGVAHSWIATGDIKDFYGKWCEENGEEPVSMNVLSKALKAKGAAPKMAKQDGKATRGWAGIRLLVAE